MTRDQWKIVVQQFDSATIKKCIISSSIDQCPDSHPLQSQAKKLAYQQNSLSLYFPLLHWILCGMRQKIISPPAMVWFLPH